MTGRGGSGGRTGAEGRPAGATGSVGRRVPVQAGTSPDSGCGCTRPLGAAVAEVPERRAESGGARAEAVGVYRRADTDRRQAAAPMAGRR